MLEIFKYTERVVNMVRPRKLLMIAVGMFNVCARQQGHTYPQLFSKQREAENFDTFISIFSHLFGRDKFLLTLHT